LREATIHELLHVGPQVVEFTGDAQARAAQAIWREGFGVVQLGARSFRQGAQQDGGVAHGAGHGAGGVLAVRDGNDAAAAEKADGGFDAHDAVHGRRADDGAIGLRAHGDGAKIGGDGGARSGARSAGVAVERVGIAGLAAAPAPSAYGTRRAEIGPFAEVGFAENDGAGGAQALHDGGVARCGSIDQRQRTGGGVQLVGGIDIVLDQYRDAVQRTAPGPAIELGRYVEGIGIDLDDRAQCGIDFADTRQIAPGELAGGKAREIGDGGLFEAGRLTGGDAGEHGCGRAFEEHASANHAPDYRSIGRMFTAEAQAAAPRIVSELLGSWCQAELFFGSRQEYMATDSHR